MTPPWRTTRPTCNRPGAVQSDHFKKAQQTLPPHLAHTPRIVNFTIPQDDWSLLGEMAVPGD